MNASADDVAFETLKVNREGGVLFVDIAAPPMNLLGPALVRDLVSLIQQAEADPAVKVLVFKSADPDYFIPHVDVTRIKEYRQEAAKLTGEAPIAPPAASSCGPATCALRRERRRSSASPSRPSVSCPAGARPSTSSGSWA